MWRLREWRRQPPGGCGSLRERLQLVYLTLLLPPLLGLQSWNPGRDPCGDPHTESHPRKGERGRLLI
jgi:hypothetical protein